MCTSGHTKWDRQSSQQERKRGKGKTEASARPLGWSVTGTSVNCLIFNLSFFEGTTAPPKVAAAQSKWITAAAVYHSDPSHSVPMLMSPNVITLSQPHTHKQLMIRTLVLFLSICRFVCLFEQSSSCAASWRHRHHFKVWNFQVPLSLSLFFPSAPVQTKSFFRSDRTELSWTTTRRPTTTNGNLIVGTCGQVLISALCTNFAQCTVQQQQEHWILLFLTKTKPVSVHPNRWRWSAIPVTSRSGPKH